ncbi:MAG: hypothetical protein L0Y79_06975 [Chlorobi bacterium]|nr:hypothetical protein [Chlorobiota bacterium]MCI0715909.1 hypothetical protein [Chlorobiota bacterium]
MLSELIASLKDNIKRRATNPFLGTFTIVYIIKNWELFYSLFNFDSNLDLEMRLNFVRKYFELHPFGWNLLACIGFTFLILASTYVLLGIGRYISNIYSKTVEPWIYKISDKGNVVLKEDYQRLLEEKIRYEAKYENERLEKSKIAQDRENMEQQYLKMLSAESQNEAVNNLKAEIESLKAQVNAKNDETDSFKKLISEKDRIITELS